MKVITRQRCAWSVWVISVAAMASAIGLAVRADLPLSWVVIPVAPTLGCATVGLVLCLRVPRNPIGWLFLSVGVIVAFGKLCDAYSAASLGLPGRGAAAVSAAVFEPLVLLVLPPLLVLFPEGRLPSRRWRVVGAVWLVAVVLFVFGIVFADDVVNLDSGAVLDSRHGLGGTFGEAPGFAGFIGLLAVFAMTVAAAVSLVGRYRRATGLLRQQLKWFGGAASVLAAVVASAPLIWFLPWSDLVVSALVAAAGTGLVVATGIAILRYRLYEIDVIIRRTLIYAALILVLALVYLGGISLMGWAFRSLTGQSGALAVTISTLIVAAAFQPLRSRIQRAVDHRFYRGKYDAANTLDAFAGRLRHQIELDSLSAGVLDVVNTTLQPSHASLWLRPGAAVAHRDDEI